MIIEMVQNTLAMERVKICLHYSMQVWLWVWGKIAPHFPSTFYFFISKNFRNKCQMEGRTGIFALHSRICCNVAGFIVMVPVQCVVMVCSLQLLLTTQILPLKWSSYNKGTGCSCIPLFFLVSSSVEYPIPFASCLASCSVVGCCSSSQLILHLSCCVLLKGAQLVWGFGLQQPPLSSAFLWCTLE